MNQPKHITPPKWPLKLLRFFVKKEYLEEVEGDMEEVFQENLEKHSEKKARRLYTWETLRLLKPVLVKNLGQTQLNNFAMFNHFLKIGLRNLIRNKVNSTINIVGLSLGITCCIVILSFVKYESEFDHYHKLSDRTFRVVQHTKMPDQELHWGTTAYPLAASLKADFEDLTHVTQTAGPFKRLFLLERNDGEQVRFEEDKVLFVNAEYPKIFDLDWIMGNPSSALTPLNSVVLSESVAKKCFGTYYQSDTSILGHTIMLNAKDALIVTGIVKDPPANTNLKFGMLVSYQFFKMHNPYPTGNWSGNYGGVTFVVLPDQQLKGQIESQINVWKAKYLNEDDDERISYFLQPIGDIHSDPLYENVPGGYHVSQRTLNTSVAVAIFLLVIAIFNFINLVTSNASIRAKEVGIRKVLGSSRIAVLKQFLIENSLLVGISLLISLGLSYVLLGKVNDFLAIIGMSLSFDLIGTSLIIIVGFFTILLSTFYPAMVSSSFSPLRAIMSRGFSKSSGNPTARRVLTLFQFVLVQAFVISAFIVGLQLRHFNQASLGFNKEKIVLVNIPEESKIDLFENSLTSESSIEGISFGSGPPMTVGDFALGTTYRLPYEEKLASRKSEMKIIDPNYLDLYNMELLAGRNIRDNQPQFDEFIVNEALIQSMGWSPEDALGKDIVINEGQATIVGVVRDFHNHSLQYDITPTVLMNWSAWRIQAFIKINRPESLMAIEKAWTEVFPESVYDYSFLNDTMEKEYLIESLIFNGFKVFSVLAIIIGCLGLFGLVSFSILQKTKEIGIRKVLGASVLQIVNYFSKEFVFLIILSFFIASPVVHYLMNQWLQNISYRIDLSPWIFIVGGLFVLLIGAAVAISKSLTAALANPIDSLRDE